jgi:hypothetical protein
MQAKLSGDDIKAQLQVLSSRKLVQQRLSDLESSPRRVRPSSAQSTDIDRLEPTSAHADRSAATESVEFAELRQRLLCIEEWIKVADLGKGVRAPASSAADFTCDEMAEWHAALELEKSERQATLDAR